MIPRKVPCLSIGVVCASLAQLATAAQVFTFSTSGNLTSETNYGSPASSSISRQLDFPGTNIGAEARMTIDYRQFSTYASASGFTDIQPFSSIGNGARSEGYIQDSLLISGGPPGTGGFVLLPWEVTGEVGISWTVTGAYAPPPVDVARVVFAMNCSSYVNATNQGSVCGSYSNVWTSNASVDDSVTMSIPFQFDELFTYTTYVTLGAGLSYSANGSDGFLTGSSIGNFENTGLLQAALVVDGSGNVIPGATITSTSGVDYQVAAVPVPAMGLWLLPAYLVVARFGSRRGWKAAPVRPGHATCASLSRRSVDGSIIVLTS